MARVVQGVVVEIEANNTQEALDEVLADLAIPVDDFLAACAISQEEKNKKARVLILYALTVPGEDDEGEGV